jgi:hypothetical protein
MPRRVYPLMKNRWAALAVVLVAAALSFVARGPGGVGGVSPSLEAAIASRQSGVMVDLSARVVRVLPDDNEGSRHQRVLLAVEPPVGGVETVLVAHNIDLAPRVPWGEGDTITVRGQYEWNDKGGVIHWTHHDPGRRREGGWIEHRGTRYE